MHIYIFIKFNKYIHIFNIKKFFQTHTGEYIRQLFEEITSEFYIEKNQIVSITTDGGSNMVAAVNCSWEKIREFLVRLI